MKGSLLTILLGAALFLFGSTEGRKFNDEIRNKAIKNTRRVQ